MKFDFHYLLVTKYAQWIVIALILLFSILIILTWSHLHLSPVQVALSNNTKTNPEVTPDNSVEIVLKAALFGIYVSNDMNENNVKKSMLNVTLVGILFAQKMDDSQVIIRAANGEEKTYRVGDSIPGDALIKRITASGVVVERHGALESLSLPKNDLTFEPIAKPLKEE